MISKKIPGMTIVCSFKSSSKKVYRVPNGSVWNQTKEKKTAHQTVVKRRRELLQVEPDVESTGRRDVDVETELV